VRAGVLAKLERAREAKLIGKSLEAMVTITAEGEQRALLESARDELATLLIVSKVVLADGPFAVEVAVAAGAKCARCWWQSEDVGRSAAHPTLCGKCVTALS
jgi:isoleucyl-tRNA synthetase